MSGEEIKGMARAIIPALVAWAAGKGWIPGEYVADFTAALVTIIAVAWSVAAKRKAA